MAKTGHSGSFRHRDERPDRVAEIVAIEAFLLPLVLSSRH